MNFRSPALFLLLAAAHAVADSAAPAEKPVPSLLPAAMPLERYQMLIERSPFAVATETAPPPAVDVAGFAKDLVLTGAARLSSGEYYITISSKDQNQAQRFGLKSGETYNGISVVSVAWSDAIGKTKVTLKNGNEFGVIGFDEAVINTAAAPPPAGPVPFVNNTGQPNLPAGVVPPNPPRTGGSVVNPGNPNTPPAPLPRRRLIRTVPTAP
ncbi:MAG: hypothetical protein WCO68_06705 [Verrucomicrobiota bacterium]